MKGSTGALKSDLRKVAVALGERRHVGDPRDAFAQARALVVGEEEHAVPDERSAERAAELVPVVVGRRLVPRREVVAASSAPIPEELVRRAARAIGAGRG